MPGHEPTTPPSDIFSAYVYHIDGDFAEDESLFGGPISMDGIFLMAYISKLETDDNGASEFYINGKNVGSTSFTVDHEYEGLMASTTYEWGVFSEFTAQKIDTPHTSFDIKSIHLGTVKFHRTYKVIILNSKT